MDKAAVIIPTYQTGSYMLELLKLLKKQDESSFDIIIVLNGPQEPYQTQIKQWISDLDMNNVTLFYSTVKGVSAARNLALDNCSSDYVVFIDDDDLVNTEYLSELMKKADPKRIIAANFTSFVVKEDKFRFSPDYCGREFRNCRNDDIILPPGQCPSVFSSSCGKLIPTAMIGKIRFKCNLFCGEDSFFMFQLLCNGVSQVAYAPVAEYRRRIRTNSASRKKYSIAVILKNRLQLLFLYTKCYSANIRKINMLFFLRRIAAVIKGFFYLVNQR